MKRIALVLLIGLACIPAAKADTSINMSISTPDDIYFNSHIDANAVEIFINGLRIGTSNGLNMQYIGNVLISGIYWTMGAERDWRGFLITDESKAFGAAMYQFFSYHIRPYEERIEKLESEKFKLAVRVTELERKVKILEEKCGN
ncbi:MAG: hypothetical protein DRP11_00020 [Candidatus Aenigmatarchaeota archaeon]|nr:MAG: hypothetical protein DRP11_00020 [Candidatus Aenigmarchaeota archaeon]